MEMSRCWNDLIGEDVALGKNKLAVSYILQAVSILSRLFKVFADDGSDISN